MVVAGRGDRHSTKYLASRGVGMGASNWLHASRGGTGGGGTNNGQAARHLQAVGGSPSYVVGTGAWIWLYASRGAGTGTCCPALQLRRIRTGQPVLKS